MVLSLKVRAFKIAYCYVFLLTKGSLASIMSFLPGAAGSLRWFLLPAFVNTRKTDKVGQITRFHHEAIHA